MTIPIPTTHPIHPPAPFVIPLLACILVLMGLSAPHTNAAAKDYFQITVVDADTGRGVPLVELTTTHNARYWTDSRGIAAIDDPELMGQNVFFHVKSDGYEYPKDGFGYRGTALQVTPGGQGQIKIHRLNIAERLYRITGGGVYRDTVMLGLPSPIAHPLLNGQVMGQDTVEVTPYRGKLYWFWGDTNRTSYPLGNFATSGATSLLPGAGGLDPSVGVDLTYWTDANGFSKAMIPLPGFGGPVWVGGLFTLNDETGKERLFTHYVHLKSGGGDLGEQGLAIFNDEKSIFEKLRSFDTPLYPDGHPFRAAVNGQSYLYFQPKSMEAFPIVRVRADMQHVTDPHSYEAFTCLTPGGRYEKEATHLDRAPDGRLIYGWKADTPPLSFDERKALVAAGKMKSDESPMQLRDVDTDAPIRSHGGSTFWNPYLHRWIMITGQAFGTPSFLGELWFAEADTPTGPWVYARKILTHAHYTFYNPTQHPFFDQEGGRLIYFEGTYTSTYSGNEEKTPRYDYNQIMYRLALDDPRLALPAPVYALKGSDGVNSYALRETVDAGKQWPQVQSIPFFAIPPDRSHDGLIAIYGIDPGRPSAASATLLHVDAAASEKPLFYALPLTPSPSEKASPAVALLYDYHDVGSGKRWYSTDANAPPGVTRTPLCRVWRNPSTVVALDYQARAE